MLPKYWPVAQNSNFITKDSIFFAIKGKNFNGINFISDALKNGATKIVTDQIIPEQIKELIKKNHAELVEVENALKELPKYCAKAWNYPVKKLKILGVTGTKGKTTTTFLLHHILKELGHKVAMISGVKNFIDDYEFKSELTTPHADFIQAFLATCVQKNIEYVVIETSAQALTLHRVDEIEFDGVVFTNLSQEHAEFYSSMQEYFCAKKIIFEKLKKDAVGIINVIDEYGKILHEKYSNAYTLSTQSDSDFIVQNINSSFNDPETSLPDFAKSFGGHSMTGLSFEIIHPECRAKRGVSRDEIYKIYAPKLIGSFNALNCADAFALTLLLGFDAQKIIEAIKKFNGVPGRMESYKLKSGALGIVDYAHTPSSYREIFNALRNLTDNLIVVFGAGGERDATKRPIMGKIAAEYADKIFVTSDNPRSEDPEVIAQEIVSGSELKQKFSKELNRELAIKAACKEATKNSIVLVLGKGPDEYQIIGKEKFFFSDKNILRDC